MTFSERWKVGRRLAEFYGIADCYHHSGLTELYYNEMLYWLY